MSSNNYKIWAQNVLPIVFDDYLQQKDLIIKLVQYVNGLVGDAVTLNNDFETIDSGTIGDLEDLHTTDKDSVVDAINEVKGDVGDLDDEIGSLKQDYNQLSADMETKANVDGSYDNMTVGNAKQLVATVGITDKTPYNFRTSGGSVDIGDREVDKLIGGTVAWNQQIQNGNFAEVYDWQFNNTGYGSYTVQNNVATIVAGQDAVGNTSTFFRAMTFANIVDHVYLALMDVNPSVSTAVRYQYPAAASGTRNKVLTANTWQTYGSIVKGIAQTNGAIFYINVTATLSAGDTILVKNAMVIDLTRMFGSTIADYIYGLEQSQAGAGVAWFKKLFPKPYYAYDAGSLLSVQTSAHKMVGFNQFDEVWESGYWDASDGTAKSSSSWQRNKNAVHCVPGAAYCFTQNGNGTLGYLSYYDASDNFISSLQLSSAVASGGYTYTAPANAYYMRFYRGVSASGVPFCINLSWDGERNGEYEPYVEYTYPLDDSLTLRGIPELDSGNNLYYDGDVYEADGTVTRNIVQTEVTSVTYVGVASTGAKYGTANISASRYAELTSNNYLSDKYQYRVTPPSDGGKWFRIINTVLYIFDERFTDLATANSILESEKPQFVYVGLTPTTESADPYSNPQIVDDFGTEEYVDAGVTASTPTRDVAIPVGHETVYQANLRAKLEMAPNSPDGDGDYIVRQTNGENKYVLLEEELPSAPTENGTYVLKVTVSDGTPTLSWVAE